MLLKPVGILGRDGFDAELDAFVANEGFGIRNKLQNLGLGFPAE